MTNNQAFKALAKGAELTVPIMQAFGSLTIRFGRGAEGRPATFLAFHHGRFIVEAPPTFGAEPARLIEWHDSLEIDLAQDEPVPGGMFLCAYYDGWAYDAEPVLFSKDDAGKTVGYVGKMIDHEWLPLDKFRCLGRVTFHKIDTGDPGDESWMNRPRGIRYDEAKTIAFIGSARASRERKAEAIARIDRLSEQIFPDGPHRRVKEAA